MEEGSGERREREREMSVPEYVQVMEYVLRDACSFSSRTNSTSLISIKPRNILKDIKKQMIIKKYEKREKKRKEKKREKE